MLTPEDIENQKLKAGYKHVWASKDLKSFHAQAYGGTKSQAGHGWWGPTRATAKEAAQDYCDHVNVQVLTIEDIRNPKRKSGFDHVGATGLTDSRPGRKIRSNPYCANIRDRGDLKTWTGPRRATAEEAAQDYVDYVNGQRGATPATLKTAGHQYTVSAPIDDPEYRAAVGVMRDFRAQRRGDQGYVYCISDSEYLKIGYSVNPEKRVAELQTGNARRLVLLSKIEGTKTDESRLHAKFVQHNVLQEWFTLEPEILAEFKIIKETS